MERSRGEKNYIYVVCMTEVKKEICRNQNDICGNDSGTVMNIQSSIMVELDKKKDYIRDNTSQ